MLSGKPSHVLYDLICARTFSHLLGPSPGLLRLRALRISVVTLSSLCSEERFAGAADGVAADVDAAGVEAAAVVRETRCGCDMVGGERNLTMLRRKQVGCGPSVASWHHVLLR